MNDNLVHAMGAQDLDACSAVAELLGETGAVCGVYDLDGNCVEGPGHRVGRPGVCADWDECCREVFANRDDIVAGRPLTPISCDGGGRMIVAPVRSKERVSGLLLCCLDQGCQATGEVLGTILERLLEKEQQVQEQAVELEAVNGTLAQSYEQLELLHRISEHLKVTQKPEVFFSRLCGELQGVVESELLLALGKQDANSPGGVCVLAHKGDLELAGGVLEQLWRRTEEAGGILLDSDADGAFMHSWPGSVCNVVGVPIGRDRGMLGVLAAINRSGKEGFDCHDTRLLASVANESAVYLDNLHLYRNSQDLLMGSLKALTSSIDAKDRYTCGHSERVAVISRWLAEQLSLDAEQSHRVYLTGLLHDIGKIGVRETVLSKPGRLESSEYAEIQKHPEIGANILDGMRPMDDVAEGVLAHHERFDGGGYPHGSHGREIPLNGRIVMLADCFDAMISDRTYRKALPVSAADVEIRRFSGTQFDPDLSDAFLSGNRESLMGQLHADDVRRSATAEHGQSLLN